LQELQSISVKKKILIAIGTMGKASVLMFRFKQKREKRNRSKQFSGIGSSENTKKTG